MKRHLLGATLLLSLAAAALACKSSGSHGGEAEAKGEHDRDSMSLPPGNAALAYLKVETVTESDDAPAVVLTGKVALDENHTQRVASPIDGRITKLTVEPGDKVKVGQTLLELSSPTMGQLQADSQKAQTDLALTQKALERAMKLKADGAVSEREIAQIESDNRKARADVSGTSSRLRSLNVGASEGASIRAQIAGSVVDRNVLLGQEVRADGAAPLLTISDLDTVWVVGDVYEQDLALVSKDAKVTVTVPAYPGASFMGTVGHISQMVDPATRTLKLRCIVPNLDGKLKPEMFAKILLHDPGNKKIVVPARAVLSDTQPPRVVVAAADNKYVLRKVEVGPELAGRVRILSGLKAGEKIVADGAIFLKQEIESQ